jgi:lysozyme
MIFKRTAITTVSSVSVAVFIFLASTIGAPKTLENEGIVLYPYYDSVGVLTWCGGETEVGYKEKFIKQECTALFNTRYNQYSAAVLPMYNETARDVVTPDIHVAFTDMAYNIGINGVRKSSMIRKINAGNPKSACDAILKYKYAGGRNCSIRSSNCYGVWRRRLEMHKLCIEGIK